MDYLNNKCKVVDGKLVISEKRLERGTLCKEVIHSGGQGCDYFKPQSRCCGLCKAWFECEKHRFGIPCNVVREFVESRKTIHR